MKIIHLLSYITNFCNFGKIVYYSLTVLRKHFYQVFVIGNKPGVGGVEPREFEDFEFINKVSIFEEEFVLLKKKCSNMKQNQKMIIVTNYSTISRKPQFTENFLIVIDLLKRIVRAVNDLYYEKLT